MSTYAIGDIQGCLDPLHKLLDKINFDPAADKLWFCGDLVNRGPQSLKTLKFIKGLGDSAITVLGNHDLHCLAASENLSKHSNNESLKKLLNSSKLPELMLWLRQQPLFHHDAETGFSLVHAGLPPQWDLQQALSCAKELGDILKSDKYLLYLQQMYGNMPDKWSKKLEGMDRLRFITNAFTRMRYCSENGKLYLKANGPVGSQLHGVPWFTVDKRKSKKMKIIFGHWSTLGPYYEKGIYALDSGCLWGGRLTAFRLEDESWVDVNCKKYAQIHSTHK